MNFLRRICVENGEIDCFVVDLPVFESRCN